MSTKMRTIEFAFNMARRSIGRRKLRAALTIMGIVIGVSTIVSLMTIGEGMRYQVETTLSDILGAGVTISSSDASVTVPEYVGEYVSQVPGVNNSVPVIMTLMDVGGRHTMVVGIDLHQAVSLYKITLSEGKIPEDEEENFVVIAPGTADRLGLSINDTITLSSTTGGVGGTFRVVGILRSVGGGQMNVGCFIPLRAAQRLLNKDGYVSMFLVKLDDPGQAEYVESVLKKMFPGARIAREETILEQIGQIMSVVNGVLFGLGSVSLAVGAIGVMNTITMSVHERTREIGMMKAVGGERWHILLIFLSEAAVIGLVGGCLGCISGLLMVHLVQWVVSALGIGITIPMIVSPQVILTALGLSLAIAVTAGLYPSWRAANIRPVEALRYE